jgi:hypothetical protein
MSGDALGLSQLPGRSVGGVVEFYAGGEQPVADRVRGRPVAGLAGANPFGEQSIHEWPDEIRRIARTSDRQLAEADDRRPEGGPGGSQCVGLVRVVRPGLDRLLEAEDGADGGRRVAFLERGVEDGLEPGHFLAQQPGGRCVGEDRQARSRSGGRGAGPVRRCRGVRVRR